MYADDVVIYSANAEMDEYISNVHIYVVSWLNYKTGAVKMQ